MEHNRKWLNHPAKKRKTFNIGLCERIVKDQRRVMENGVKQRRYSQMKCYWKYFHS